jgi:hypothetical protein
MRKYLTVEMVVAQCGRQQSQNRQCLSRKKSQRQPICIAASQYPTQRVTDPKKKDESQT